jgi:hypothetical protein
MRTDKEILDRIETRKPLDWLGIELNDLVDFLPYEAAKPFLRDEVTREDWRPLPRDRESVLKTMHDYMSFAWEKANTGRGISASRSMHHYMAWTWILGDDFGELTDYQHYGKDNLVRLCKHYGWDASQWDDGERYN